LFFIFVNTIFLSCFVIISDLYKMVCSENDTAQNVSIPVVMISKSGGEALNKSMADGQKGDTLNFLFLSNFVIFIYACEPVVHMDC
jgi:hypothetical protein